MNAREAPRSRPLLILGSVAALLTVGATSWFLFWHAAADRARETGVWRYRLSAMADDRRFALDQWIRRGLGDARTLAGYPTVRQLLLPRQATSAPSAQLGATRHLGEVLETAIREQGYRSAALISAAGVVVEAVGTSRVGEASSVGAAQRAIRERGAFIDAWRGTDGSLALLFAAPAGDDRVEVSGAIVLESDPESFLLPLLRHEAMATRTCETTLARRDSSDAVFIAPPKRGGSAPLGLRRPLDTAGFAMRVALDGEEAFGEFSDYGGVAVLAATRRLHAAPWGLVVKVDVAEAFAIHEQRMRSQARTGAALALVLSALVVALLRWRNAEQEARLNASRAHTALLLAQANDSILFVGPDGHLRDANRRATEFYGGTLLGRHVEDLRPEEERASAGAHLEQARAAGVRFETVHLRFDGSRVPVEVSSCPVMLDGEMTLVSVVRDLTERKQAEARTRAIVESAVDGIITTDGDGLIESFNPAAGRIFGYTPAEVLGRDVSILMPSPQAEDHAGYIARYVETGKRRIIGSGREVAGRRKDGTVFPMDLAVAEFDVAGRPAFAGIVRDLTDHKRLEAQLLQARKMEAIGRLAGGIAHDFNNLLGVILGCAELLSRQASAAQRANVERILEAARRGAALTGSLLAFGRRQAFAPKVLDLNSLVSSQKDMLARLLGEDVTVIFAPGDSLGHVKADAAHLEQALMNLCVNARDAMANGGVLRITTADVDRDTSCAALPGAMPPGRYVKLTVADNGCGIEEEVLDQIFEPFFTTKEAGKGTGLGLSTVLGSLEQAGGYIRVDSRVGLGTTFEIYLPRVDDPTEIARDQQDVAPPRGSETILLVEDEPALRAVTRQFLEEGGYRVFEASSGEEAVAIARGQSPIHLLLTDVVMPAMGGRALAKVLSAVCPGIRVLYVTGYSDDVVHRDGPLEQGALVVAKPFTQLALLQSVREVLGGSSPSLGSSV